MLACNSSYLGNKLGSTQNYGKILRTHLELRLTQKLKHNANDIFGALRETEFAAKKCFKSITVLLFGQ
jgi:hypothetical protein